MNGKVELAAGTLAPLQTVPGDIKAALDAGEKIASIEGRVTKVEDIPVALIPKGYSIDVLDRVLAINEKLAPAPRRRTGTAVHQELDSFIAHINRFKDADSTTWADTATTRLTAVLNYHRAGAAEAPGWGDHRAVYVCPLSREWKLWLGMNGKPVGQEEFGQFIEDNMVDLASPTSADADFPAPAKVLEMARTLVIRTKGEFSRSINPTTGESSLVNKLENETSSTKIPRAFLLGIPVFEGGALYRVEARMRFSMPEGKPKFTVALYQTDSILRDAFGEVRKRVADATALPVFIGIPE